MGKAESLGAGGEGRSRAVRGCGGEYEGKAVRYGGKGGEMGLRSEDSGDFLTQQVRPEPCRRCKTFC